MLPLVSNVTLEWPRLMITLLLLPGTPELHFVGSLQLPLPPSQMSGVAGDLCPALFMGKTKLLELEVLEFDRPLLSAAQPAVVRQRIQNTEGTNLVRMVATSVSRGIISRKSDCRHPD